MALLDRSAAAPPRTDLSVTCVCGGRVRVAAAGTLSLTAARGLEDAFNQALDAGARAVLIDLSAVGVADSRVVHTLLRMADQAHSVQVDYRFSPALGQLLERAGVSHHLSGGSVAEAPSSRRRRSRGRHREARRGHLG